MSLCHCGCGLATKLATHSDPKHGVKRGDPRKFVAGHCKPVLKDPMKMYVVNDGGCWVWTGDIQRGYARLAGRLMHREMYRRIKGEIPEGLQLDHLCRNTACVNPDHLEPVEQKENVRRGNVARLTVCDVMDICQRLKRGESCTSIARLLSVNRGTISRIKSGHNWRDVAEWQGLVPARAGN